MPQVRCCSIWLIVALAGASSAIATPNFFDAWQAKYPTSTLPDRMHDLTGAHCHICHHPPSRGLPGNCYRQSISELLTQGRTIQQALDELDGEDSDGDGVPNGVEATMPRADQPGEVGYNMGLVGGLGMDPCSDEPGVAVTGQLETPPSMTPVPAVSDWGLLVTALLFLTVGSVRFRRRQVPATVRA